MYYKSSLAAFLTVALAAGMHSTEAHADFFTFKIGSGEDQAYMGNARVEWGDGQLACNADDHGFCEIMRPAGPYDVIVVWQGRQFPLKLNFDGSSQVKVQTLPR